MRHLHPEQRFRPQPERTLEPHRHFGGEASPAAQQVAHRLPRHAQPFGGGGDAEAVGLNDLGPQPGAGMQSEARMQRDGHQ
jgi:hypothetical protein